MYGAMVGDANNSSALGLPGGWTDGINSGGLNGTNGIRGRAMTRVASGEGATQTLASGGNQVTAGMLGKMWRVAGHDTTTPVNAVASAAIATGASTITLPSVTTTVDDCLVIRFVVAQDPAVRTFTFPTATEQFDFSTDPGRACSMAVGTFTQVVAGATGTEVATASAGSNALAGGTIAIAPAVVAATATGNRKMRMGVG
jgi:hypothetical protein